MAGPISKDRGQISVRLTDAQAKALERYRVGLQRRMASQTPGWVCSTSHAIRHLILTGLIEAKLLEPLEP
jgi:hypothetical protein